MIEFDTTSILFCLLASVFTAWALYQDAKWWYLRLPLYFCCFAGLLLLWLRPHGEIPIDAHKAIFCSENTPTELLDSLFKVDPDQKVYSTDTALVAQYSYVDWTPDFSFLQQLDTPIVAVTVLGDGLDEAELPYLDSLAVEEQLNLPPSGIHLVRWSQHLREGERLQVQGSFHRNEIAVAADKAFRLHLIGAGGVQDSVVLKKGADLTFDLSAQLKQAGKHVWHLATLSQTGDTLAYASIPFSVEAEESKKILLFSAQASFELKFLKRWLVEEGYPLAHRAKLSKDKYQEDFKGIEKQDLSISREALSTFDLLVVDEQTALEWNTEETALLKAHIRKTGMGILVLMGEKENGNQVAILEDFDYRASSSGTRGEGRLQIGEMGSSTSEEMQLPHRNVKAKNSTLNNFKGIIRSSNKPDKVFAAVKSFGLGRIAISTLFDTYKLALKGKKSDHQLIWGQLFDAMITDYATGVWWRYEPFAPKEGYPLTFILPAKKKDLMDEAEWQSPTAGEEPLTFDLQLNEHQNYYIGKLWPDTIGWHQLVYEAKNLAVYVHPKTAWNIAARADKINKTVEHIQELKSKELSIERKQLTRQQEYPLWYWFLLFVFSWFFLWVIEKRK